MRKRDAEIGSTTQQQGAAWESVRGVCELQALQRRVDSLSALVDEPQQLPNGATAEFEQQILELQRQLQDKEEDLQGTPA